MPNNSQREKEIFNEALEMGTPDERHAFVRAACGEDEELRHGIEALLEAYFAGQGFLPTRMAQASAVLEESVPREGPGGRIGRYKLLQQIGEGGCGVVYMAEQEEPVRRRVALKVIKLGMDTKQVIARFEAERQALAMMDHPNIAKVLDAGMTGNDRTSVEFSPQGLLSNHRPAEPPERPLAATPQRDESRAPVATGMTEARLPSHLPPADQNGGGRDAAVPLPAGRPFFVMELVRGIKITDYCDQNHLSTRQRLELFVQVCQAIQHAHQKAIIHRDIKPSNILVSLHDGVPVPVVIDFGIAKAIEQKLTDKTLFTAFEQFMGTPVYTSPEQAEMSRLDIDTRSDIYSLGVLLYELLTGKTPFDSQALLADGLDEMRRTIREKEPVRPSTRLSTLPGEELTTAAKRRGTEAPKLIHLVRGDLDWIVMKCLEKDRTRRYDTAHGLAEDIERYLRHEPILARPPSVLYLLQKFVRRQGARLGVGAAVGLLLVGLLVTALMYRRASNLQWAKGEALPRVLQLAKEGHNQAALDLAQRIQGHLSNDPALRDLWPRICTDYSVATTPAGAEVWCREYTATNQAWRRLGRTPIEKVTLARCMYRWRFEKEGFATRECVGDKESFAGAVDVRLRQMGEAEGMAWIGPGPNFVHTEDFTRMAAIFVPEFLMDQHEVTNERFKRFVDQGGYQNPQYWKELRFVKDGRELAWAEAMQEFRDRTGQPGPATWQGGTYPPGQEEYPVCGVSWYEAMAYARFAGKSLPSVHHWDRAACLGESQVIVPLSNLGPESQGLAPVGHYLGMGHTGLGDVAGNVREWCLNATDNSGEARYILGGSWNEPTYVFAEKAARSAWNRAAENGFRGAQFLPGETAAPAALFGPLPLPAWRDYSQLSPLADEEFAALRSMYRYDRRPLNATVEGIDDSSLFWRKEKLSFDAAYGGDRVIAHLFLPKTGKPPYQTVIFFPGVDAVSSPAFTGLPYGSFTEYIVNSGRALLFPIYYGTYERPAARGRVWTMSSVIETPWAYRDWMVHTVKDLARCIDFLETRRDLDRERMAYYGVSHGAILGPVMLAIEDRVKTGVLAIGGLVPITMPRHFDMALYAQRVQAPVLMVNGTEDPLVPLMASAQPMYELLHQANEQTTLTLYAGGHGVLEGLFGQQIRQDVLTWLDRYLGPVEGGRALSPQHNSKGNEP
jgi:serine/threonine protein kinase/dienelactone hydrolase